MKGGEIVGDMQPGGEKKIMSGKKEGRKDEKKKTAGGGGGRLKPDSFSASESQSSAPPVSPKLNRCARKWVCEKKMQRGNQKGETEKKKKKKKKQLSRHP